MSTKKKILKKEDLLKFDNFIQDSLNKFFFVNPWDKLYLNTGKYHYDIISNKSTIPDLIIYNKTFNKNDCFYNSSNNYKYIKFPRIQFILRPKKVKNYNPINTYIEEKEKEETQKNMDFFKFRSIPKEIEDKYMKNDKSNNDDNKNIYNELKDFFKNDKDETLINININNMNINSNNNMNINSNNNMNINSSNNMNYNINYYKNMDYQKMDQYIQFNNHINFVLSNLYKLMNTNRLDKNNQTSNEKKELINNSINNSINNETINKNVNDNKKVENAPSQKYEVINNNNARDNQIIKNVPINNNEIKEEVNKDADINSEESITNFESLFINNMAKPGWKVINTENNSSMYKFNNQQLFYFLRTIINRNENVDKLYYISDLEQEILFSPKIIYEKLKKKLQK